METSELLEFLCNQLKNEEGLPWLSGYSGSYREDTLPNGSFTIKEIGVWLWVKAELDLDGSTMDQTSGVSGDPYEANVEYHWIGLADNAPEKVSSPEELDTWAKLSTRYVCENNDMQGNELGKIFENPRNPLSCISFGPQIISLIKIYKSNVKSIY